MKTRTSLVLLVGLLLLLAACTPAATPAPTAEATSPPTTAPTPLPTATATTPPPDPTDPPEPEPTPEPIETANRMEGCWVFEPSLLGDLRLAWIEAGDLGLWDRGRSEPFSLTASGDVTAVRLSPNGDRVLFTRSTASGGSLWVAGADGSAPSELTAGQALPGEIEMNDFSWDGSMLAFTHTVDSRGELWAAALDGSSTKLLVSQQDLMDIMTEPLADFAAPTGVTWIPKTLQLTYDALPRFENDGIYIHIQRQVWVVDALSGQKAEKFAFGEGGQVEYSPDGNTMLLLTPEELRLMNVEAGDLHDSGIPFFATGFGEFYLYPAIGWAADSQSFLVAQPADDSGMFSQDVPVDIWRVSVDGSEPVRLGQFSGFVPSFRFSPDLSYIAYWRSEDPQTNQRDLHFASVDGSNPIVYDSGKGIDFIGWAPDSQTFLYTRGVTSFETFRGFLCEDPTPVGINHYPSNVRWVHELVFTFERIDEDRLELYIDLRKLGAPGPDIVLNIENFGGYDYFVLPAE